jgi:hypothetical protein
MRWRWLALAAIAAGCGGSNGVEPLDLAMPAGPAINLTGLWASQLELHASDGATWPIYAVWAASESSLPTSGETHEVDTTWELCSLKLPNRLSVPYDDAGLAQLTWWPPPGSIVGAGDGSPFTQPPAALVGGAHLTDPLHDALPTGVVCAGGVTTGCISRNVMTGEPGVRVPASGLTPDADVLYVEFRLQFAFGATVNVANESLNGDLAGASLESRVVGCHLRSGAPCGPSEVAALQAAQPSVSFTGGAIRSHMQGSYFTCTQLLADPEAALTGRDPRLDGGMQPDAGVGTASYPLIQGDVDFMGCATGGCHEQRTAPGQMHLVFQPATDALRRQNWQQVLPWTSGPARDGQLLPGGRFVNEVVLPSELRARWLDWIAGGASY